MVEIMVLSVFLAVAGLGFMVLGFLSDKITDKVERRYHHDGSVSERARNRCNQGF